MATIDVGKGSKWECGGEWVGWMCMYICVHLCGWVSVKYVCMVEVDEAPN